MINYKHLHYFWAVAKEGGVTRASERLHLTPQTISGQLALLDEHLGVSLFKRVGRNLELTDSGRLVLSYADEIFSLGGELEDAIHQMPADRPQLLRVGVVDVVPKYIAHHFLQPALQMPESVRMVCREGSLNALLAELSVHRLDMILSDQLIPPTVSTRGYSHQIGESAVSFFASENLKKQLTGDFPDCLNGAPFLMPGNDHQLRAGLDQWLDKHRIYPRIVAEFDDSALMKTFGQEDAGIFVAPEAIGAEVERQYKVKKIGCIDEIKEQFYAISVERKVIHPVLVKLLESARKSLFAKK